MERKEITANILSGRHQIWGLYGSAEEAVDFYVRDVQDTIEPIRTSSPEIILEALSADYFKRGSSLNILI